ncbi:MAG: hypothetical protein KGL39_11480 [Patescibacteria group bacterium]|nr:hypothetical protein [Patescibacteria group bacterium]
MRLGLQLGVLTVWLAFLTVTIVLVAGAQAPPPIQVSRMALEQTSADAQRKAAAERETIRLQREFQERWDDFAAAMNGCGQRLAKNIADRKVCTAAVKAFDRLTRHEGWPK